MSMVLLRLFKQPAQQEPTTRTLNQLPALMQMLVTMLKILDLLPKISASQDTISPNMGKIPAWRRIQVTS
jgi:hypothetical protein